MTVSFSTAPGASRQLQTKAVCDATENVEAVVKWRRKERREYCATLRWQWWFDGSQLPRWRWKFDGRNNTRRIFRCLYTAVSTRSVGLYPSVVPLNWYQYLLFWWYASALNICLEVEQYSVAKRSCLLQETLLKSYIFPRNHIQGKDSSCPDLQSMCLSLKHSVLE